MNQLERERGFALITVTAMMAIVMALALALMQIQLSNAQAAAAQYRSIQARLLLDSALHYAAISIASPRSQVALNAVPFERLSYPTELANVSLYIDNEAGRLDLTAAHPDLLDAALKAVGVESTDLAQVRQTLHTELSPEPDAEIPYFGSARQAWSVLQQLPLNAKQLWNLSTLVTGEAGVNPELASAAMLAIVPGLSSAEQTHLLARKLAQQTGTAVSSSVGELIADVSNPHLRAKVSSFYRVHAELSLGEQYFNQTWIIQMHNEPQRLFSIYAHWQE